MTSISSKGFEDQFGKLIADNTQNKADIAGHFPFSPERWRYYRENTNTGDMEREFVQYGDKTGFTDKVGSFRIDPPDNGIANFRTAERYRYVVGYVKEISFAFQLNQSLQSGDKLAIGYGDPDLNNNMSSTDGYILEFEPDLDDNEAYFSMYRNGTVVSNGGERMLVKLERSLTDWGRLAIHFNWYNVGNAILTETYTKGGEQLNPTQAKVAPDFEKGPQEGNKRLYFSIQDGGNGLELETGSVGVVTLGDVTEIRRTKGLWQFNKSISSTNTWVPLTAIRLDPNKRNTTVDISSLEILGYTASDDLALICKAFDNTNVTFTGNESWETADHITGANSATQERTDIDQFSDDSGTLVNNTTTPGGYKLADSLSSSSGGGQSASKSVSGGEISLKRSIFNSDVAVIMGKSGTTGEVDFEVTVSEDW